MFSSCYFWRKPVALHMANARLLWLSGEGTITIGSETFKAHPHRRTGERTLDGCDVASPHASWHVCERARFTRIIFLLEDLHNDSRMAPCRLRDSLITVMWASSYGRIFHTSLRPGQADGEVTRYRLHNVFLTRANINKWYSTCFPRRCTSIHTCCAWATMRVKIASVHLRSTHRFTEGRNDACHLVRHLNNSSWKRLTVVLSGHFSL